MTDSIEHNSSYFLEVSQGDYIFRQNDPGDEMFVVEEGRISIETANGKELTVFSRGDFFGEMAILEDLPRSTSARAKTNARLLRIDRPVFDQIIKTNPEFAVRLLRTLSSRLRDMDVSSGTAGAPVRKEVGKLILRIRGGADVELHEGVNTIGRHDPSSRTTPDVDLSEIDKEKTTSRRHARITVETDKVSITEEKPTANGTFVNGQQLEPGTDIEIKPGDQLAFGGVSATLEKA